MRSAENGQGDLRVRRGGGGLPQSLVTERENHQAHATCHSRKHGLPAVASQGHARVAAISGMSE